MELIKDIGIQDYVHSLDPGFSSYPESFTVHNGLLYFVAREGEADNSTSRELWVTDGTPEGTQKLTELDTVHLANGISEFLGNQLLFSAHEPETGSELYVLNLGSSSTDPSGQDPINPPPQASESGLELGYGLRIQGSSEDSLTQLAALGDSALPERRYELVITAQMLADGWRLEEADITLYFDPSFFNDVSWSDITITQDLPLANAVVIDNVAGSIRIAAGSVSELGAGAAITAQDVLATISFDLDELYLQTLDQNADGSFLVDPLVFSLDANLDETILTRNYDDGSGQANRETASLADLDFEVSTTGVPVTLYEARINLEQQGEGMVLGTNRVIGADAGFTNLVRSNDVLEVTSEWLNVGNITANNVRVSSMVNENASMIDAQVESTMLKSGSFVNGAFVEEGRESTTITAQVHVHGSAGSVVNLAEDLFSVEADGSGSFSNAGKGSKNLITYQGDLNYDGRVSMKDLAYLNAGAARQTIDGSTNLATPESYARDVDADFNGKIDLADLAVLDADWGKSLHTGDEDFLGSADLSWSELDSQAQGAMSWDNGSFKTQNAVEASADYIGSLESPGAVGVIGADGDSDQSNADIASTYFQEPVVA